MARLAIVVFVIKIQRYHLLAHDLLCTQTDIQARQLYCTISQQMKRSSINGAG